MEKQLDQLRNYELLREDEIVEICNKAINILIHEPNIRRVSSNIVVVGDIHGQFSDLLHIFDTHGSPEKINYLFLGDFVDRGENSLECILCLLIYKVHFPDKVTLLRGNHEQKVINKVYGFYDEVSAKYPNKKIWEAINAVFDYLNIACIIDGRYFCTHGGISPRVTINKLERVDRFEKLTDQSIINDVLWSDPFYRMGVLPNPRGNGCLFGEDVLKQFLMFNNVEILIRSHQLAIEGFKWDLDGCCLTIWSAPNYMGKCSNPASVLLVEENLPITSRSIKMFQKTKPMVRDAAEAPNAVPNSPR